MDVISTLLATAEAIDKVINVTEAAKRLQYWRDEQKRKDFWPVGVPGICNSHNNARP
jgi:hypothetical protein